MIDTYEKNQPKTKQDAMKLWNLATIDTEKTKELSLTPFGKEVANAGVELFGFQNDTIVQRNVAQFLRHWASLFEE